MNLSLFRVILEVQDFYFFASFDYKIGLTQDAIHNYSLMYALWNKARFASRNTPHYLEDLPSMQYYATPARPIGSPDLKRWRNHRPTHFDRVRVTYNSLTEISASKMEQVTINIPLISSYYKFPPLTNYEFYLLSPHEPKGLIRIGKKLSPARLKVTKLDNFTIRHEKYKHRPDHFVNMSDIPKGTKFLEGTIMYGFPTPLVANAVLESDYYIEVSQNNETNTIQLPSVDRYPTISNLVN
jgi:CRISPR type I-D-associated protein Csc1